MQTYPKMQELRSSENKKLQHNNSERSFPYLQCDYVQHKSPEVYKLSRSSQQYCKIHMSTPYRLLNYIFTMCASLATIFNTNLQKFTNSRDLHNNTAKYTCQHHTDYLITYLQCVPH